MRFKRGDKIRITAEVVSTNSEYGWIGVVLPDGNYVSVLDPENGVELVTE